MTRTEIVTMALLTTLGATALDAGVAKVEEFETRFGVKITTDVVVGVFKKIADLLSGQEPVIIDDGG